MGEVALAEDSETTEVINAGSGSPCPWPGDLDRTTGPPNLKDFAVLQRCLGLSEPTSACDADEFSSADLRTDSVIDLLDYAAFAALGWPRSMTIDCGFADSAWYDRCGPGCLPEGDAVETGAPVFVGYGWPPGAQDYGVRRIQVARNSETLAALMDPSLLGDVDFETSEVLLFTTLEAVEQGCWGNVHCYNGTVDLTDGRRAVIVGFVEHGYLICLRIPWAVTRAVVAPRSDRPVVMLFIEQRGDVTQTLTPLCASESAP